MIIILLSTYNGEKYLNAQLDSLMKQNGVKTKILIRDDGSIDNTVEIIKFWQSKYPEWIDFIQGNNCGYAQSFTILLQLAIEKYQNAAFFAFCDQDDIWLPDKLQKAQEKIQEEDNNIPITYCSNTKLVDANLNFIRYAWKPNEVKLTKERAMIQSFATGCTMVFNRKAVEIYVSHIPEKINVHDFLMYQLCMFLGKVIYDNNSYILYRQHSHNQIGVPNFWKRWKRRFTSGHYKKRELELQNYRFLKAYKDLLSIDDIGILSNIVFYRRNIYIKLSLLFNSKIRYTKFENNLFYILKIIIGGV